MPRVGEESLRPPAAFAFPARQSQMVRPNLAQLDLLQLPASL